MARFLFAWELGANYGHLTTFNAVATELAARGHDVYVAVQNLAEAGSFFPAGAVHFLQSPLVMSTKQPGATDSVSYAHVIEKFGFQHPDHLTTLLSAWRELYRLIEPDVVTLNAPPAALLAARQREFKLTVIGPGYHYPPRTVPLPRFMPEKGDDASVTRQEQKLLHVINPALERLQLPQLQNLCDLFSYDHEFLTTFQELDHFPQRQGGRYYGAQFSLTSGADIPWPEAGPREGEDKRIFVYARPDSQHFKPLIQALREVPMRAIVASPGLKQEDARTLSRPHLHVHPGSVRLERIRAECDLAISAGGHGTTAAFLLGGVPMILLPNHVEQLSGARAAVATGGAIMPRQGQSPPLLQMIRDGIAQPRFRTRAAAFADKYRDFKPEGQAATIAGELEGLLAH